MNGKLLEIIMCLPNLLKCNNLSLILNKGWNILGIPNFRKNVLFSLICHIHVY